MMRHDADVSIPLIEEALHRHGWHLRFGSVLEGAFRRELVKRNRPVLLICTLVSCVLFPLYLIPDFWLVPDVFGHMVFVRVLVFVPVSLLFAYMLWRHPDSQYLELIGALIPIVCVCLIFVVMFESQHPERSTYIAEGFIGMIFGTAVHRPRFRYSLGVVCSIVLFSFGYLLIVGTTTGFALLRLALVFMTTGGMVLMTGYTLERAIRQAFLHRLRAQIETAQLETTAMTDPLTSLSNRRHFDAKVEALWDASARRRDVVVIMMDIDHFKRFNDAYGHLEGDQCLIRVAQAIKSVQRGGDDVVTRFGGEEVVVLMTDADITTGRLLAERMRMAIHQLKIPHHGLGDGKFVSASFGVAAGSTTAVPAPLLVEAADQALYAAKTAGRDCVCVAEHDPAALGAVDGQADARKAG